MSLSYQYTTTGNQNTECEQQNAEAVSECGCQNGAAPVAEAASVDCGCGCDCAPGMLGALRLLCHARFSALIDYSQFAFITDHFVLGTSLSCPDEVTTAYDNLTGPLAGELTEVSPSSCRRLGVSGQIYDAQPACSVTCRPDGPGFSASELSLCSIDAIAFGVVAAPVPAPTDPTTLTPYQQAKTLFYQTMHPGCPIRPITIRPTPCDSAPSPACTDLDCRRTVSLTAGPLVVGNVSMIGKIGGVYVLANDTDERFYFVCADSVDFVG